MEKNLYTPNNLKFPCSICNKNVLNNQKTMQCDLCNGWCHIKCDGTALETYNDLMLSQDDVWHCLVCKVKYNFPFTLCDNIEIENLNNSNSIRICESLPKLDVMTEVSKFSTQSESEVDYNLPVLSSCKYYSVREIQNLNAKNNHNLFHSNVNGLGSKFDTLYEFISSASSELILYQLVKPLRRTMNYPQQMLLFRGMRNFTLPPILAKEEQHSMLKKIMMYLNVVISKCKMIVLNVHGWKLNACIYRHPKYDLSEFMSYLETSLKKVVNENKEVYICGDFNIDLLEVDEISNYQLYYNLLCSFGFLPLITQPTRVVDNQTPSLIDNIFCNNLSDEIIGGNIYLTLSEHFCQFASVKREKIDIKNINIYTRNYSKFSSKDLISMTMYQFRTGIMVLKIHLIFSLIFLEVRRLC